MSISICARASTLLLFPLISISHTHFLICASILRTRHCFFYCVHSFLSQTHTRAHTSFCSTLCNNFYQLLFDSIFDSIKYSNFILFYLHVSIHKLLMSHLFAHHTIRSFNLLLVLISCWCSTTTKMTSTTFDTIICRSISTNLFVIYVHNVSLP